MANRAPARVLALLVATSVGANGPEVPDTVVEVQGFLQRDTASGRWSILLPQPLALLGTRSNEFAVQGEVERWTAFQNRFVELQGRASSRPVAAGGTPALAIRVADMKEVEPSGTSRRAVNRGPVWHALVTLAVVPHRIAWQHAEGLPLVVTPVLFYGIANRQAGAIVIELPTDEMLCVSVKPEKGPVQWSDTTRMGDVGGGGRRFVIPHGSAYREAVPLPQAAAPQPGRYVARAGICRIGDYDVSANFEVE